MSRLPLPSASHKPSAPRRPLPRETFGMLRDRGFRLSIFCDPCKDATSINLLERPDLAGVPVGGIEFECRQCRRLGHYRLEPPHRPQKRQLHEEASPCRGPADEDPQPFIGPFPLLTTRGDHLVGDLAALGVCLLATCPGGRERLIDPRDGNWHHLHGRSLAGLRLRCQGCRARVAVTAVPAWYKRKGFKIVRATLAAHAPAAAV